MIVCQSAPPASAPEPRLTARSMLSLGTEDFLAFWMASNRVGLPSGSPPPVRAATSMFLISLANSLPRLASLAAFWCLVVAHLEWPLIVRPEPLDTSFARHVACVVTAVPQRGEIAVRDPTDDPTTRPVRLRRSPCPGTTGAADRPPRPRDGTRWPAPSAGARPPGAHRPGPAPARPGPPAPPRAPG